MPNLFVISGCNGAGKTTASYTVLPDLLNVREFVNADEIARGLSPFQPDKVSIEAGKIMLKRLDDLLLRNVDFAFETTLSSKTFVHLLFEAKSRGYQIHVIYYWLDSVDLAIERVKNRVSEGGHDIPIDVIICRYHAGLRNFLKIYRQQTDYWMLVDNSNTVPEIVAEGKDQELITIFNEEKWNLIIHTTEP